MCWEELVKALQENFEPIGFQNSDEHLCGVKQTTNHEYRQEFAGRASRVTNGFEHSLLGDGLKDELKVDV